MFRCPRHNVKAFYHKQDLLMRGAATDRLPRWRIGEQPSDMEVSCELSGHLLSDE